MLSKFHNHQISPETEILILGIFSTPNEQSGDFFFGRSRMFLWHMLPLCFNQPSLQEATLMEKLRFMKTYKIDFMDVVKEIDSTEPENSIDDDTLDSKITAFSNLEEWMDKLTNLKAIYFTRKTFNGIPTIKQYLNTINDLCATRGVRFCKLDTPARHYSQDKIRLWTDTIVKQKTCLRV